MRALLLALGVTSLLLCSCDDETNRACDKQAMQEMLVVSYNCTDTLYLTYKGYANYNECVDNDTRMVALSIISCKGRDGIVP